MLRLRAVRELLAEEVGGVARAQDDEAAAETAERHGAELERAARRALGVVLLDAVAVAALFLLRDPIQPFLTPGGSEQGAFTVGVLLVVGHAGYRLAQYRQLRTVARLHRELGEREGDG